MDVSVVIPTCRRNDLLRMTLEAYARQTVGRQAFEVVVVEDGPSGNARSTAEAWGARYVDGPHTPGPAGARNLGICRAQAPIVLLTGDDMVPAPDLLERHLEAHRRRPGGGVLGHVAWHPDCRVTPFMRYIVERGGQFSFHKIADPQDCGYRFFYTSNVSLEARWLARERFDEVFPWAATEDLELGYRLQRRGLILRYCPQALVYHQHAVDMVGFGRRMERAGETIWYFALKYPDDRSIRRRLLPFTRFPGGVTAVIAGGWLLSLLPPCRAKYFGFLCTTYARGVARAMRRARRREAPQPSA